MKNVTKLTGARGGYRIPVPGLRLRGWALKYVSGIPGTDSAREGDWLADWFQFRDSIQFSFEPELHMAFTTEDEARRVCEFLRTEAEIETEVVKVG